MLHYAAPVVALQCPPPPRPLLYHLVAVASQAAAVPLLHYFVVMVPALQSASSSALGTLSVAAPSLRDLAGHRGLGGKRSCLPWRPGLLHRITVLVVVLGPLLSASLIVAVEEGGNKEGDY